MTPDTQAPVPLTALAAGACARLHTTQLDHDTRSLLRSLGLTDASRLRVCKCGEPLIIQVRATRIGLSSSVAGSIYVVLDGEPHGSEAPPRTHEWIDGSSLLDARPPRAAAPKTAPKASHQTLASSVRTRALGDV